MRFYILTLGCPKNEVDSEGIAGQLIAAGHVPVDDPAAADALVVNTCGFIDSAREESFEQLKSLAALKRRTVRRELVASVRREKDGTPRGAGSPGKLLIAAGCLSQRYPDELWRRIPELDGLLGTLRWAEIDVLLREAATGGKPCWTGEPQPAGAAAHASALPRLRATASAYLKIADGCDAPCAFCAIPRIKGPQRSRPLEAIVAEARSLASQGVQEIVLIAQDTTAYGRDLAHRDGLPGLLEHLVAHVPEIPWFRIMYAYPAHVTDRLIEVMAAHRQIVKYLDIPLQHGHPAVLRRMLRPASGRQVVMRLRAAMPEIALRSAFIVGYPGETEEEFRGLLGFLEEMHFDRVGIFRYSGEEGTKALEQGPPVVAKHARSRYNRAMTLQQRISLARNRALVGQTLDVLVEGEGTVGAAPPDGHYGSVGRSYRDAPEVDGLVFVRQRLPIGKLARVRITKALPYDLVGEAVI